LGLLFIAVVGALDWLLLSAVLIRQVPNEQISFLSFLCGLLVILSLPVLAILIYETLNCATLRYQLDRNGVIILRAGWRWTLPIGDIQEIRPGVDAHGKVQNRRGLHWPGHEQGEGDLPGEGTIHLLATRPAAEQLLLFTPGEVFAISPRDPDRFVKALEERRALGPNRLLEREEHRARWLTWPLWTDRVAWVLLGSALLFNLLLFGYLSARFPRLDLQLPLHFSPPPDAIYLGEVQVDRIGGRMELFAVPIIGLIILGTNLVLGLLLYKRERAGSYLLWGAAAAAQFLFWLATFGLVG
jgi:hypothetical protein